jgi:hypothetical protein
LRAGPPCVVRCGPAMLKTRYWMKREQSSLPPMRCASSSWIPNRALSASSRQRYTRGLMARMPMSRGGTSRPSSEFRGRGYGRALIQRVESWCLHRAICLLTSDTDTAYPLSPDAHARAGFRKLHDLTIFIKELEQRHGEDESG